MCSFVVTSLEYSVFSTAFNSTEPTCCENTADQGSKGEGKFGSHAITGQRLKVKAYRAVGIHAVSSQLQKSSLKSVCAILECLLTSVLLKKNVYAELGKNR